VTLLGGRDGGLEGGLEAGPGVGVLAGLPQGEAVGVWVLLVVPDLVPLGLVSNWRFLLTFVGGCPVIWYRVLGLYSYLGLLSAASFFFF